MHEVIVMANQYISSRLKQARIAAGMSQKDVYVRLGIAQSTFSAWETGVSEPGISTFLQICEICGIDDIAGFFGRRRRTAAPCGETEHMHRFRQLSPRGRAAVINCLAFEYAHMEEKPQKLRNIRVFLQPATAGLGNYLDDTEAETMELEAPEEADIGIRISGDSMEPQIHDGDIVFVKYQPSIEENEIGIFLLNGDAYCKRLGFADGKPVLISLNGKYSPISINSGDSLVTYGKVLL